MKSVKVLTKVLALSFAAALPLLALTARAADLRGLSQAAALHAEDHPCPLEWRGLLDSPGRLQAGCAL